MTKIFLYLSILLPSALLHSQQNNETKFGTLPQSKLWIEGTSTLNDFSCGTSAINGFGVIRNNISVKSSVENQKLTSVVSVSIAVERFDCGNPLMNDDMYSAMKAEEFPFIQYELMRSKIIGENIKEESWSEIETVGYLTIAGVKRIVNIPVKIRRLPDGKYNLVGSKELSMYSFYIEPPTAFFGLIKADPKLIVNFDLIVDADVTDDNEEN